MKRGEPREGESLGGSPGGKSAAAFGAKPAFRRCGGTYLRGAEGEAVAPAGAPDGADDKAEAEAAAEMEAGVSPVGGGGGNDAFPRSSAAADAGEASTTSGGSCTRLLDSVTSVLIELKEPNGEP
jgi:hypothetical protein